MAQPTLRVACPSCRKTIAADAKHAGKRARCPACGAKVSIPVIAQDEVDDAPGPPVKFDVMEALRGSPAEKPAINLIDGSIPPPLPSNVISVAAARPPEFPHPVPLDPSVTSPGPRTQRGRKGKQALLSVACFAIGFFAGREYLKWEIRSAFSKAAEGFATSFAPSSGGFDSSEDAGTDVQAEAEKVLVLAASCRTESQSFGMSKVSVRLKVRNDNNHAVSRIYFHGVLKSPNRAVPWCDADFNYSVPGGLERGETQEWALEPNMFDRDWSNVADAPPDAKFTVTVRKVEWPKMTK